MGGAKGLLLIIKNGLTNHENLPPPRTVHVSYITYIGSVVQRCSSPYGQQERRNVGGGRGMK